MIKGLGYLKYLKQSLIGFGISCFMVLGANYVSAGSVSGPLGNNIDSLLNFNPNPLKLTTSDEGLNFYFGWDNGQIYFAISNYNNGYIPGTKYGYTTFYYSGNNNPGDFYSALSNGTFVPVSYSLNWGEFDTSNSELIFYDINGNYFRSLCSFGKTNQGVVGISCQELNGLGHFYSSVSLNSSDELPIGYSVFGQSPIGPGSSIDGGSYTGDFNNVGGNVVNTSCTKSLALQWYRCNGYKTRMCYSSYGNSDDLYTAPGVAQGYELTGVDIEDVRFNTAWYRRNGTTGDSMSYKDWFAYWRKTFNVYKQNPQHTNPFLGVPVSIFTLMGNVNSYGNPYTNESILEFCDLSLYTANYNNPYTGVAYNAVCSMSPIELIDCQASNGLNPDDGYPGDGYTNGTVGPVGSSWDGITNRTGYHDKPGINTSGTIATGNDLNNFDDGTTFLNNFFNKLSDKFEYSNNNGVARLPSYIIVFLCAVILFKFLRK